MIGEQIRQDFPLLSKLEPPIYLDSACMTLKPRSVIDAVVRYYEETPFCAGRAVYEGSLAVEEAMEAARCDLAALLGGRREATVFTKNATEAINLVAHAFPWRPGDVVLTTDREHNSNLVPWQMLSSRGVRHEVVPSREDGTLDLDAWRGRLARGDVALVAAVHVSNLDGYEAPVRELTAIAHEAGAKVLLDGAQAAGHQPVDLGRVGADFYAVSLHKMLGPTGVGALLARPEALAALGPFMTGGDTVARTTYEGADLLEAPAKFEAGLQNYAGLAGSVAALAYLRGLGPERIHAHACALMRRAAEGLAGAPGLALVGAPLETRAGIVPFTLDEQDPHTLAILLEDKHRVLVRSGDHCLHSWFNARGVPGAVRASVGPYTTAAEIDAFVEATRGLLRQLAHKR
ncbi:MAG: cysteine desulfurase / selenocysteine lyase [Thermoplasmata archaeon]|jgi:cysteine desulfurase/selenocysteine lyase|nr:cysteine desulfurase / selenocysteine lyase [Thermoplasmata archaeon]